VIDLTPFEDNPPPKKKPLPTGHIDANTENAMVWDALRYNKQIKQIVRN
jgi:hypothetical protein